MSETQEQAKFEGWAIVELMGRQVIAGFVSEQVIAGAAMLRVDVPATDENPSYTKFYGGSAIYAVTPTAEDVVRRAVERLRPRPVEPWIVNLGIRPERHLVDSHRGYTADGDDDDEEGEDGRAPF